MQTESKITDEILKSNSSEFLKKGEYKMRKRQEAGRDLVEFSGIERIVKLPLSTIIAVLIGLFAGLTASIIEL